MRSRLCSSAEGSTPPKTNHSDCAPKASQHINKTKNKKKTKYTKNTTLHPQTEPDLYCCLDQDPSLDIALRGLDLSLLRTHTSSNPLNDPPLMTRQQMILARRLPIFNFPSTLYQPPPILPPRWIPPPPLPFHDMDLPSYDPPDDTLVASCTTEASLEDVLMGPAVPLALMQSHISHDLNPPTEDLLHDSLSASCSATCHLGDCLTDPMALLAITHCLQLNTGSPLDPTPHDPPLVTGGLSLQLDPTSNEPTSDHSCSSETSDLSHVDQAYRPLPLCDNLLSPSVDSEVDLMSSSDLAHLLHRRCLTDISPRPPTTSPLSSLPPCPPSPPPPLSIHFTHPSNIDSPTPSLTPLPLPNEEDPLSHSPHPSLPGKDLSGLLPTTPCRTSPSPQVAQSSDDHPLTQHLMPSAMTLPI